MLVEIKGYSSEELTDEQREELMELLYQFGIMEVDIVCK